MPTMWSIPYRKSIGGIFMGYIKTKCIIDGCDHAGRVWVDKRGPYCYTHHHELHKKYKSYVEEAESLELKPLE